MPVLIKLTFRKYLLVLFSVYVLFVYFFHAGLQNSVSVSLPQNDVNVATVGGPESLRRQVDGLPAVIAIGDSSRNFTFEQIQLQGISNHLLYEQLNDTKKLLNDEKHNDNGSDKKNTASKDLALNGKLIELEEYSCKPVGYQKDFFRRVHDSLLVFSAYIDSRANDFDNNQAGSVLRMMAIVTAKKREAIQCKFLVMGELFLRNLTYYEMCENHNKRYGGFILSCPVPEEVIARSTPCSVQLVGRKITPSSGVAIPLTLTGKSLRKSQLGICVPPLFGSVPSAKLRQFFLVNKLLGVNSFTIYNFSVTPDMSRILYSLRDDGFDINIINWPLSTEINSKIWYHGQIIAIQDCLYRNMNLWRWTAFSDLDEFFVPQNKIDLHAVLRTEEDRTPEVAALQVKSAFFVESKFNGSQPMLDELYLRTATARTKNFNKMRCKCIVIGGKVFEAGIHHISKPIWANLQTFKISTDTLVLNHYRKCQRQFAQNCNDFVEDRRLVNLIADANNSKTEM